MKKIKKYQQGGFPQAPWLLPDPNNRLSREMDRMADHFQSTISDEKKRMIQAEDRAYEDAKYYERLNEKRDYLEDQQNRQRAYEFSKDLDLFEKALSEQAINSANQMGLEPGSYEWMTQVENLMYPATHDKAMFDVYKSQKDINVQKLMQDYYNYPDKGKVPFFSTIDIEDYRQMTTEQQLAMMRALGTGKSGSGSGKSGSEYKKHEAYLTPLIASRLGQDPKNIKINPITRSVFISTPKFKPEEWQKMRDYIINNKTFTPQHIDKTWGDRVGLFSGLADSYDEIGDPAWQAIAEEWDSMDHGQKEVSWDDIEGIPNKFLDYTYQDYSMTGATPSFMTQAEKDNTFYTIEQGVEVVKNQIDSDRATIIKTGEGYVFRPINGKEKALPQEAVDKLKETGYITD